MGASLSLLQRSFTGAVLVVIIAVLRAILLNRLPKRTFLVLWGAVILRLLLPFAIPSQVSVYSLAMQNHAVGEWLAESPASHVFPIVGGEPVSSGERDSRKMTADEVLDGTVSSGELAAVSTDEKKAGSSELFQSDVTGQNLAMFWCAGVILCVLFFVISYVRGYREFRTAIPVTDAFVTGWLREQSGKLCRTITVRQSDRISAPLTYGIFHPVILMPKATDWANEEQLRYILTHEYMHIRYFDVVFKLISAFTLCIHWFNPAVWILYVLFNRDIELACDEHVVRQLGISLRADYALALINMEEKKSRLVPFSSSFSKTAIEERIMAIMKIKKFTAFASFMSAVLVLEVVMTMGTSAADYKSKDMVVSMADTNFQGEMDGGRMPEDILGDFRSFGISWEETDSGCCNVYWEGQPVKAFLDMRPGGEIYLYPSACEEGIYVCSVYDEGGAPCGVAEYTEADETDVDGWLDIQIQQDIAGQWADILAPYTPLGLSWSFELGEDANSYKLTMYYQNQEVRGIVDTGTDSWITDHAGSTTYGEDAAELYTVYTDGVLTGLRLATEEEQKEWDKLRNETSQEVLPGGKGVQSSGAHHTESDHYAQKGHSAEHHH